MGAYILRRFAESIPVVLGVTLVVFLLIQLVPGDIAYMLLGPEASADEVEALREELGLNQPLPVQYLRWLTNVLQGDLGTSIEFREPVTKLVWERLQNTMILGAAALTISTVVGLFIGVISAVRPYSIFDRFGMIVALLGNSMPGFWIAMLLILGFGLTLRWFPVGGMYSPRALDENLSDLLYHLVLPAISLGSLSMAVVARLTRSSMLDVLKADYMTTARAKGLAPRMVIMGHGLRNALLPVITVVGLQFGNILGGAVLTETVFSWPGLGRLLFRAISTRDLPLIQGGILLLAVGFVMVNLLVDVLYVLLDPRVRLRA